MRATSFFRIATCLTFVMLAVRCAESRADIMGFNNGTGWQQNGAGYIFGGGGTSITGDQLTVTTADVSGNNSAFYETPQAIGQFVASFTYTDAANGNNGPNGGNGIAFVIQNDPRGATVYTYGGGSTLGYGAGFNAAISPSIAVELNVDKSFTPPVGTAIGINGSVGPFGATGTVALNSGDPIAVTIDYNGSTLSTYLHDTITGGSFSQSQAMSLSAIGAQAYIGFTGGSGLDTATQVVSNFTFTTAPEPASYVMAALGALGLLIASRTRRRSA